MDTLTNIKEITIDQLVDSAVKAQNAIEELEGNLKMVKDEIGQRLTEMKVTGTKCGEYYVSRQKRVSFPDVTLQQATELGAVMTKVDSNKLKRLYDKGIQLKAKISEFIVIRLKEEK